MTGPADPLAPARRPDHRVLEGARVGLRPPMPDDDVGALWSVSHGTPERESLWDFMGYGPFPSRDAMRNWLVDRAVSTDPVFYAVIDRERGDPVGMASYLRIVPEWSTLEVGHLWYAPEAQRTHVNTETLFLLLAEAFDRLGYRRVEWKCDDRNERSKAAARRLGFRWEGLFRQHMPVKGRLRDTAWFSMLRAEWALLRPNYERCLSAAPGEVSLGDLNAATLGAAAGPAAG